MFIRLCALLACDVGMVGLMGCVVATLSPHTQPVVVARQHTQQGVFFELGGQLDGQLGGHFSVF